MIGYSSAHEKPATWIPLYDAAAGQAMTHKMQKFTNMQTNTAMCDKSIEDWVANAHHVQIELVLVYRLYGDKA